MGDREPAAVEPDMAAQTVEEGLQRLARNAAVLARIWSIGLLQAVGDRDLAALQPAARACGRDCPGSQ